MKVLLTVLILIGLAQAEELSCDLTTGECFTFTEDDLKKWRIAWYIMGFVFWTRTALPMVLSLSMLNEVQSLIAPTTDLFLYLPFAALWSQTGTAEAAIEANEKWVVWSKWAHVGWVMTTIHVLWYSNKQGINAKTTWPGYVGIVTEAVLWILYYVFAADSYKYLTYINTGWLAQEAEAVDVSLVIEF